MDEKELEKSIKKVPQLSSRELEKRFSYHVPKDENTKAELNNARQHCLDLAYYLNIAIPEGREKSLAMTHLEEVMFWANAGIARNG